MFELEVIFCQDKSFVNKETNQTVSRFKVWVKLPDGSGAYVNSSKAYPSGSKVKLILKASPYKDTDGQLYVSIAN